MNLNGEKLIEYNIRGQRHTQLFNLNIDQMETNDISDDPMHLPDVSDCASKCLRPVKSTVITFRPLIPSGKDSRPKLPLP